MKLTDVCGIVDAIDSWPETVWLLVERQGLRHGVFKHEGVFGLACFQDEATAKAFALTWGFPHGRSLPQSFQFDDARAIAQSKATTMECMYLFGATISAPVAVHWIR